MGFYTAGEAVTGSSLLTGMDFPDPAVIRVGDTYYMASTTMHFSPGCAILRSYDLIHWEWCGHAYKSLDDTDARALKDGQSGYGKGMWAPSLAWHEGTFYVLFVAIDTGVTHLLTTTDPENDTWEHHTVSGMYYDASLFFDEDGRVYIIHGNSTIRLTEMEADLSGPKKDGLDRVIAFSGEGASLGYEGSHFYKINGQYYLFTIHSLPDRWRRVESCLTAKSLTDEFTGGIVFNDDLGYADQGIAQGGVVDTPDGRWYAVLFQDHGALGRVPVLIPMGWADGMPVIGHGGRALAEVCSLSTRPGHVYAPLAEADDFTSPALAEMWEFNHIPDADSWRTGDGGLTLTAGRVDSALTDARNTLTVRAAWPRTTVTVKVDGTALNPGDTAGLCALQYEWGYIGLHRSAEGYTLRVVEMREDDSAGHLLAEVPAESTVQLRMEMDFSRLKASIRFLWLNGDVWQPLGGTHSVSFDLRHFVGVRPGLFLLATQVTGGQARFEKFGYAAE